MKKILSITAVPLICGLVATVGISGFTEHSKAQSSSEINSEINLAELRNTSLTKHNEYRNLHGSPTLVLDDDLNKSAQEYAEKLAKMNEGVSTKKRYFQHSKNRNEDVGENLAYYATSDSNKVNTENILNKSVKLWYDEIEDYNFKNPELSLSSGKKVGHFTQLVWKETTKVGCGAAKTNMKMKDSEDNDVEAIGVFVVCHYSPQGNIRSEIKENVLPLQK